MVGLEIDHAGCAIAVENEPGLGMAQCDVRRIPLRDASVEVLSPATMAFDLACKLQRYAELPSVQEIWMVDSSRAWVQVWQRQEAHWSVEMVSGSARFRSAFLNTEIALDQVYAGVTFRPETEDDADAVGL